MYVRCVCEGCVGGVCEGVCVGGCVCEGCVCVYVRGVWGDVSVMSEGVWVMTVCVSVCVQVSV